MPQPDVDLSSYDDLASVLANIPLLLRETRRQRRLSARATAQQVGCAVTTITRIEQGADCALSNAMAILRWMHTPPTDTKEDAGAA